MADQVDDDSVSETVLDHIDGLIDLSQKARELEEVVTSSSERQATEIGPLVEEIAAEISQDYPAASITVEYDNEIQGRVLQNFDRAIEELIENAVKHTGDNPSVTVAVEIVPNGIEIQIKDNGPGLPDHEAEVLTSGVETPLAHGSGLGLWLALLDCIQPRRLHRPRDHGTGDNDDGYDPSKTRRYRSTTGDRSHAVA